MVVYGVKFVVKNVLNGDSLSYDNIVMFVVVFIDL